ncbi:MAG: dephospho-CoA kinase [Gammaproteobacteria bacterium]|nr:dephospho-CoA kinase [Gammaproteobacteria bacterium]
MLRIGLTGGIGSGKSTVAAMFARRGAPVIDTDEIAHDLVRAGQPALQEIERAFGADVIDANGNLDRAKVRGLIFDDPTARHRLEAILHPRIRNTVKAELAKLNEPYCIIVVPLLIETHFEEFVDRVLVVDADKKHQIERTMMRDGVAEQAVVRIMAAQAGRSQRLAHADDVIANKGTLEQLEHDIERLDTRYRALAAAN